MFLDPRIMVGAGPPRPDPRDAGSLHRATRPRRDSCPGAFGTALIATTLALIAAASPALAAWPYDPNANLPVCTAPGHQDTLSMIPDGAGGALVAWEDHRSGNRDIYAQHLLSSGSVDPAWPANGLAVCTSANQQGGPQLVSDGAGGAIITWHDFRSGSDWDVYAQHVLASGTVDPAWTGNGVAVCARAGSHQQWPAIATDGAGGAIVAWEDNRESPTNGFDIYMQRVRSGGQVAWGADGRIACAIPDNQLAPIICTDGAYGAIIAWRDNRPGGTTHHLYAQHADSAGTLFLWGTTGRAIFTADNAALHVMMPDDSSGAYIVFQRTGTLEVWAQRIRVNGQVAWVANGRTVSGSVDRYSPSITSDGSGGAIVAFDFAYDVFAQRIDSLGTTRWPTNGGTPLRAIDGTTTRQWDSQIAPDGAGGAIVAWPDDRSGNWDVYAQHVQASGVVDPVWPANGRALCTASYNQCDDTHHPRIVSDGVGGAIVAWPDYRTNSNWDVYAQRVEPFSKLGNPEAVILAVEDNANDQGGMVHVAWSRSYLDSTPAYEVRSYNVWRQVTSSAALAAAARGARLVRGDEAAEDAIGPFYRMEGPGAQAQYWEFLGSVPARGYHGYSFPAATLGDSMAASIPYTVFRVGARDSLGRTFWYSDPDSGYSVDNLAPAPPEAFAGTYAGGTATLHWNANAEPDLAAYRLYRGLSADFVPGPGNLVAEIAATEYVDVAGSPHLYKLMAVDVHGNASPAALVQPDGVVGVPGANVPREVWLAAPSPNPVRGATTLRFALPAEGAVSLAIYDLSGRQVREIARAVLPAGEHERRWDGRDDAGQLVRSGLYFVRLQAAGRLLTVRMVTVR